MSILIKSMEMPHDCLECYVAQFCKEYEDEENKRPYGCPLVEIPPHGRLIDADKLKDNIPETKVSAFEICSECGLLDKVEVEDFIDDAPTVIESEEQENETN